MDFTARQQHFAGYGPDVIFVPMPCGGCPGRRVSRLLAQLRKVMKSKLGVTPEQIAVHLSSCMVYDSRTTRHARTWSTSSASSAAAGSRTWRARTNPTWPPSAVPRGDTRMTDVAE